MTRLTFYRKYRSQHFSEIVGQEHVITVLSNAIQNNCLSHAYIFSGPRGTGKTSIARIFAKAVNTHSAEQQFEHLDSPVCERITNGTCVDIIEIDAASNTGVDNIRDLKEKIHFAPVECAYKFYIIDEVHMLSSGAFNALLKTLEEPPANTIFVLATTEPHKIPVTIHSRCQHLRFRNLTEAEIVTQLQAVCDAEDIQISPTALSILARNAGGCMRDGLSLLDQMFAFQGKSISDENTLKMLGTSDIGQIMTCLEALYRADSQKLVETLTALFQAGVNPLQLLKDLVYVTEQVLSHQSNCAQFVTLNAEQIASLAQLSTLQKSVDLLDCFAQAESESRWFSDPALLLNIRLLQFITTNTQDRAITKDVPPTPKPQPVPVTPVMSVVPKKAASAKPVQEKPPAPAPEPSPPVPDVPKPPVPIAREDVPQKWDAFLEQLKRVHTGLFTILRQSKVAAVDETHIEVHLYQPVQFFVDKLAESSYKNVLNKELNTFFGQPFSLRIANDQPQELHQDSGQSATQERVSVTGESQKASQEDRSEKQKEGVQINDIVSMFEGQRL